MSSNPIRVSLGACGISRAIARRSQERKNDYQSADRFHSAVDIWNHSRHSSRFIRGVDTRLRCDRRKLRHIVSKTDSCGRIRLICFSEPGTRHVQGEDRIAGFRVAEYPNIQLLARQTIRVDGQLSVADQEETVNVMAEVAPVITREVSNIAETKTGRELLDLPIPIGSRALGSTSPMSTLTTQVGVSDAATAYAVLAFVEKR